MTISESSQLAMILATNYQSYKQRDIIPNTSDSPAERVQVLPRPLGSVNLVVELLCHNHLRVHIVQVSQVHYKYNPMR